MSYLTGQMTKKPLRLHWENYYENEPVSIEIMCRCCTEKSHWLHKSLSIALTFAQYTTPLLSVCVAQGVISVLTASHWLSLRLCIFWFGHCVLEVFPDLASCNSSASINRLNSGHLGQISVGK